MAKKSNVSQMDDYKVTRLTEEKLNSSGLDLNDAKVLHIDTLSPTQTTVLLPDKMQEKNKRGSLKFNYHTLEGKPLLDKATKQPYHRIRLLGDEDHATGGKPSPIGAFGITEAAPTEKKRRPARYFQPAKSLPHPYFPTNLSRIIFWQDGEWVEADTTWAELAQDPDLPLILTEGELKAAKACREGYPTIGLGGVHAWKSGPHGLEFLPELEDILWHSRKVYICFDSDVMVKTEVASALEALSSELVDRGADVFIVLLPAVYSDDKKEAPKTGLDDFFVHVPAADEQFRFLLQEAQHFGLARKLFDLNHKYAYVMDKHFILNMKSLAIATPTQFKETEGNVNVLTPVLKQGKVSYEKVSAPAQWLKWPLRGSVESLIYQPCPPGSEVRYVDGCFNTWQGYAVEPKPGDVSPFLKLIDHLFTGTEPGVKDWFLRWLAYPLQRPSKMLTACVLWGVEEGTGKSIIGKLMGRIYGKNYSSINQSQLHSTFNPWAHNKQFIMGEEITGAGDKRSDANVLKDLITNDKVWVNTKNVAQYQIDNFINFLFTSNHPDAFYLGDRDRRYFIHHVTVPALPEKFYKHELDKWERDGGPAHLFDYLLNLDLKDMHHNDRALETEAKRQMIEDVRSELSLWVAELKTNPDACLRLGDVIHTGDLFTSAQLLNFYNVQHDGTGTTTNAMGRELKRAGFVQAIKGSPIRTHDGLQNRYFVIRNSEKWMRATLGQAIAHLNQFVSKR